VVEPWFGGTVSVQFAVPLLLLEELLLDELLLEELLLEELLDVVVT
jgi:hypothetical protein